MIDKHKAVTVLELKFEQKLNKKLKFLQIGQKMSGFGIFIPNSIKNLLNSILFSLFDTKLHKPTFPFARPTASNKSPELRYEGATHRIYWYRVSDANKVAVVANEISKFISE